MEIEDSILPSPLFSDGGEMSGSLETTVLIPAGRLISVTCKMKERYLEFCDRLGKNPRC